MSALQEMPAVTECSVDGCSYNVDHDCHAAAVTISGDSCATFIPLSTKGGLDKVIAHVGACQRVDCTHNDHLECGASSIRVGAGASGDAAADCLTFTTA